MKKIILILAVGLLLLFAACSNGANETNAPSDDLGDTSPSWQTITAAEASGMMAEVDSFILLDVRTDAEFQERRIDGALLIPYDEIRDRAEAELPDKNAVILIYCRSGRRSALAAADLATLGYTNVYDFGGIIDWSYELISG